MADQDHRGHHLNEDSGLFIDDISESRVIAMEAAEDAFSIEHSCPKMPDIPETSSSLDITLNKEYLRQIGIAYDDTPATVTHKTRFMTAEDFLNVARYQKAILPAKKIYERYPWVQYLFDETNPAASKVRCGLCYKYSDHFKIKKKDTQKCQQVLR